MLHVQFKNKGALVFIYGVLALAVAGGGTWLIKLLFNPKYIEDYFGLCFSATILLAALLIKRADEDYVIDDTGEKHYMNFDNQFMWLFVKVWIWFFYALSGFTFMATVGDLLGL